ncbi:hypothetical protein [Streptomyces sp. NPDC059466]|uniref:hypothetical protein n=1 Tax=unclassified Streptomyces TaxID=2593676 RepID=UPI00369C30E9
MINSYHNLLTGLDEVDWSNLNHAYGTAADVPGQLRALCGIDEQARQQAVSDLFNHLAHQGSRCQAAPYAVPFLSRIALAGPGPAREHALELLSGLAVDRDEEREIIGGADIAAWRAEAAENAPEELLPCTNGIWPPNRTSSDAGTCKSCGTGWPPGIRSQPATLQCGHTTPYLPSFPSWPVSWTMKIPISAPKPPTC